jgi:hypothetical protein
VPADALYSDGAIALLRSREPFPGALESRSGFFTVPNKSFARLLSPRVEAGAAGKTALAYDPYIASLVAQVSSSRIAVDDTRLVAFVTRYTLTDSVQAAGTWIRNQFLGMGYADVQYHTFSYQSTTQKNVVCTVPGTRFPNQYIIVDGHYDSISQQPTTNAPGADDNGTGVASVLEVARLLQGIPFDYSIRYICFAAEEQGLIGSTAYANYAQSSGMQIKLLINLDMIGYPQSSLWTTIVERDQGNANSGNDAASYAYADTMKQATLLYTPLSVVHGNIYASDYMPFESRGYVCIGLFENGDNPNYHTTGDVVSTVNFSYVRDETKALLATLMHVARVSDPNAPVIVAPALETLVEGQSVSFTVTATDLDDDPLTYGARNLPSGASYDSTGTRLFSWNPTLSQAGEYDVLFIVDDGRGKADSTTTHITVLDTAPRVAFTTPPAWDANVSASILITAVFDQDLDPATISESAVRVHCSQTGLHPGLVAYDPANRRMTFAPAEAFQRGELVTVTFTKSFKAMTGYDHEGFTLQFLIECVRPTDGTLTSVDTPAVGNTPLGLAAADLDEDGAVDLAASNFYGDTVSLLWNAGSLTFTAGATPAAGDGPQGIAIADLDADGLSDIVATSYFTNQVLVLWNQGGRVFSSPSFAGTMMGPRSVAVADLDGDGLPDLATVNGVSDNVSVIKNLGGRVFGAQTAYAVGDDPYSVVATDVDGDGHLDLAAVKTGTPRVVVLKNLGNAVFSAPTGYSAGSSPYGIAAGDVTGDGAPDLAVANGGSGTASLLMNAGNGTFGAPADYATANQPRAAVIADMTGDGALDVVVANGFSDNLSFLRNTGAGAFAPAVNTAVGDTPRAIVAADLDGDGDVDIASVNSLSNTVSVLRNGPQGTIDVPADSPPAPTALLANRPNPFNPSTVITFRLVKPAPVELAVYDVRGRLVRWLARGERASGEHRVGWDGRDESGREVASGLYLYRLTAAGFADSKRMVLAR